MYVDVDADGYDEYDERTSGSGCSSNVCEPYNIRDGSRLSNSRWSCKRDILESSVREDGFCIVYYFDETQDIIDVLIAFPAPGRDQQRQDTLDTINSSGRTRNVRSTSTSTKPPSSSFGSATLSETKTSSSASLRRDGVTFLTCLV